MAVWIGAMKSISILAGLFLGKPLISRMSSMYEYSKLAFLIFRFLAWKRAKDSLGRPVIITWPLISALALSILRDKV